MTFRLFYDPSQGFEPQCCSVNPIEYMRPNLRTAGHQLSDFFVRQVLGQIVGRCRQNAVQT